ncbi:MAG TPA: DUF58 domain-containing protein [Paucimonas sp.]|nr:DUF58 domain-containing protein [Paucimonas sp.]
MVDAARQWMRQQIEQRLFRLRPVENGEIFLYQRRVFIIPSSAGLGFAALLVVLFIGSVNYNLSLGFGLTFLLGGCALIDMTLTFRNLAHLSLLAGRTHPVFAGEEAQFELLVINRRKHDRYALRLGFVGKDLPALEQTIDVPGGTTRIATLAVQAQRRGWLQAPRVRLHTKFPLGLFFCWAYWSPDARALVYPRPEDDAPPLPSAGLVLGDGQGAAGNEDFAGVRAYQAGDSLRQLAWRQIARISPDAGSTLVTKHFEGGAASELCLDYRQLPPGMDHEARLSRLTRWVLEAEARGAAYALQLGAIRLPAAIGPAHREACLRALALFEGA